MIHSEPPEKQVLIVEHAEDRSGCIVVKIFHTKEKEQKTSGDLVELASFGNTLRSIAFDYQHFLKLQNPKTTDTHTLLIRNIRTGSLVTELVPYLDDIVLLGEAVALTVGFVRSYKKYLLPYFHRGGRSENVDVKTLQSFHAMLATVAQNTDREQTIEAIHYETDGTRTVKESITITGAQAHTGQKEIKQHIKELNNPPQTKEEHKNILMRFKRGDRDDVDIGKRSGERVIVEDISDKGLPFIYGTEQAETRIKDEIRESHGNVFKKIFLVDLWAEVQKEKLCAYRVMEVHDVFDLPNE